ncbi:hypothetical protein HPB50_000244 [Hyalomma asiaticum]|uniref:Uncharacterized protein n=1 Tax=Hyalomma asiaticum TaxID=266040 RepID=A0ACB7S993_HYAAI|nr:hypothetical protein HPB50_000244 [Hyalomma asiaticum]
MDWIGKNGGCQRKAFRRQEFCFFRQKSQVIPTAIWVSAVSRIAPRGPKEERRNAYRRRNKPDAWLRHMFATRQRQRQPLGAELQGCRLFDSLQRRRLQGRIKTQGASADSRADPISVVTCTYAARGLEETPTRSTCGTLSLPELNKVFDNVVPTGTSTKTVVDVTASIVGLSERVQVVPVGPQATNVACLFLPSFVSSEALVQALSPHGKMLTVTSASVPKMWFKRRPTSTVHGTVLWSLRRTWSLKQRMRPLVRELRGWSPHCCLPCSSFLLGRRHWGFRPLKPTSTATAASEDVVEVAENETQGDGMVHDTTPCASASPPAQQALVADNAELSPVNATSVSPDARSTNVPRRPRRRKLGAFTEIRGCYRSHFACYGPCNFYTTSCSQEDDGTESTYIGPPSCGLERCSDEASDGRAATSTFFRKVEERTVIRSQLCPLDTFRGTV